jgi:hypothetical protein
MAKPQVEIEVDEATGRWYVDGLPMILIPQHFFVNNHVAVESALGADEFGRVLAPAGYKSAYFWCEREAEYHKLTGVDVFRHYMRRLSQRGWAQFKVLSCDETTGDASVRVDHSLLVTGTPPGQNRKLCYMFGPWLQGSFEYVMTSYGRPTKLAAREIYCAAEGQHDHCLFEVAPET